jgi:hypothetical protein
MNNWKGVKDSTGAVHGLDRRTPGAVLKGWLPHSEPGTDGGDIVCINKVFEFLDFGVGLGKEKGQTGMVKRVPAGMQVLKLN